VDICKKAQEALGRFTGTEKQEKVPPSISHQMKESGIQETTWLEKCSDWNVSSNGTDSAGMTTALPDYAPNLSHVFQSVTMHNPGDIFGGTPISSLEQSTGDLYTAHLADHSNIISAEEQEVYSYLIGHEAFATLMQQPQQLVEQYFGNQAKLIRHRVVLALRRPGIFDKAANDLYIASFRTEWDVVGFLENSMKMKFCSLYNTYLHSQVAF
jgi:hypothetical protein